MTREFHAKRIATHLFNAAGIGLLAASIVYLGQGLWLNFGALSASANATAVLAATAVGVAVYSISLLLQVWGFQRLARALGLNPSRYADVLHVYGQANIAKFLPGNVLHYVGRQVLARRLGWPQAKVAAASTAEALLQAYAALLAMCVLTAVAGSGSPPPLLSAGWLWAVTVVGAGVWLVAATSARYRWAFGSNFAFALVRSRNCLGALGAFVAFFAFNALLFWAIDAGISGAMLWGDLGLLGVAYLSAWLVGFLTPGAPGGLGVREAALVLTLGGTLGEAHTLLLALVLRCVTSGGDLALFVAARTALMGAQGERPRAVDAPQRCACDARASRSDGG